MEAISIIIAEKSQLVRLGLFVLLNQMGYPLNIREVTEVEKLKNILQKDPKGLIITSKTFLKSGPQDGMHFMLSKPKKYLLVLINDDATSMFFPGLDVVIEPYDIEKVIFRKLEKIIQLLSNPRHIFKSTEEISPREKEVLKLVALGMTNREIAEKLFISSHTVITHRKNITAKLGIKTIAGLTVYAVINKLIAAGEIK